MEENSIRKDFIRSFIKVIGLSLVLSSLSWVLVSRGLVLLEGAGSSWGAKLLDYRVVWAGLIPFVYIVALTKVYGRRLEEKLSQPIKDLIDSSHKIKNGDLDFKIHSEGDNELARLGRAFEDMRAELEASLKDQWEMEEERRETIHALSHDLKTPLSIVKLYSQYLLEEELEDREPYIRAIDRNNNRAINILRNLNRLSLVDNNLIKLNPERVDIRDYLGDKLRDYQLLCGQHGLELESLIEDYREEAGRLNLDLLILEEVLDSVVLNSIKHSQGNHKIKLIIELYQEKVNFLIKDYGSGFIEEDMENLFNKFYKGDKSRGLDKDSSGIGLYVSKKMVEKHGGSIIARNEKDGAAVEFSIASIED